MGKLIGRLAIFDDEIDVVAACDIAQVGQSLSQLLGIKDPNNLVIQDASNLEQIIADTKPNVAVDFT
ncbi:MAG: hypothetical protein ACTSQS_07420, partial [Promethearchaeota archaeon]